jgi:hypothetical protein
VIKALMKTSPRIMESQNHHRFQIGAGVREVARYPGAAVEHLGAAAD